MVSKYYKKFTIGKLVNKKTTLQGEWYWYISLLTAYCRKLLADRIQYCVVITSEISLQTWTVNVNAMFQLEFIDAANSIAVT